MKIVDPDDVLPYAPVPVEEPLFAPDIVRVQGVDQLSSARRGSRTFVADEEVDLLDELRAFVAFGASVNGQASTEELLGKFQQASSTAIKTELGPLFKFLLKSIATFHRDSAGRGIWKLNAEFR
jgi:hypothetical protein